MRPITEIAATLGLLVNSAGFGLPGQFIDTPVERSIEMIGLPA